MPIDRFDTENYVLAQDRLLEYVTALADEVAPDFVFCAGCEPQPTESQAPRMFCRRYNAGVLNVAFSHEDYIRAEDDESPIAIIRELGIDEEKFWYLLLFVSDYVVGSTYNAQKVIDSPVKELEKLIDMVERNEAGATPLYGVQHRTPMTLSVRVHGRVLEITNAQTISLIAAMCRQGLSELPSCSIFEQGKVEPGYTKSESVSLWLFARLMMRFFDLYPCYKNRRRRKGGPTCSVLHLISKLAYLTRFTTNRDYCSEPDNMKAIMRQYRDYEIDTINSIYG